MVTARPAENTRLRLTRPAVFACMGAGESPASSPISRPIRARMFVKDPRTCSNRPGAWPNLRKQVRRVQHTRGSMAAFLEAHLDERMAARFWVKVDKNGPLPEHCPELGPCWVWTSATDPKGYGRFGIGSKGDNRVFFAHRVALALSGSIPPDDLKGCHHCDNPPCCNPGHLFLGTHDGNMADMTAKGRSGRLAVCGNGHLQNALNAHYYFWRGYWLRRCRACDRDRRSRKRD